MIEVRDLSVRFGGVVALDGVGLDVDRGEVVAVIGPNGSGKSTLFNGVTGFVTPAAGSVHLDGDELGGLAPHKRVALGIARTFQTPRVDFAATVRDTVLGGFRSSRRLGFGRSLLFLPSVGREERDFATRCDDLLSRFKLGQLASVPIGELAMGQVRIVEVARAMAMEPAYLLLDEPAAGLSREELEVLREGIRRLARRDVGVLLVEHNFGLVKSLADRVFVLDRGKLIASGEPAAVAADERVREAYLAGAQTPSSEEQRA